MTVQVVRGWTSMNGHATHSLQTLLQLDAPMTEDGDMARRFAQRVAEADPNIAEEGAVVVVLVYGYDMALLRGGRSMGIRSGRMS